MKPFIISALLISMAAPAAAAVELPNFGTGSSTVRVKKTNDSPSVSETPSQPAIDGEVYSNPIDREIAIATYEFTYGDSEQAFERLERVLPDADSTRKTQIESQLFLNYLHLSSLPSIDQAERWLKRAAVLKPDDPRPYRGLREVYCYKGKLNLCKQAHREAVKRSPDETFELTLLAGTLEELGEYEYALVVLRAAMAVEREKADPDRTQINDIEVRMREVVKLSR